MSGDLRWCTSCRRLRPLGRFGANPRMRDGLHSRCRECVAANAKDWRARNRDYVDAFNAARRVGPPPAQVCELVECGREFQATRRGAKFCSRKCRDRAAWLRTRARP